MQFRKAVGYMLQGSAIGWAMHHWLGPWGWTEAVIAYLVGLFLVFFRAGKS